MPHPCHLFVLLCATAALGDEIHFKNGDRLSGQIVRLTEGKLVLKSQLAGEVTVTWRISGPSAASRPSRFISRTARCCTSPLRRPSRTSSRSPRASLSGRRLQAGGHRIDQSAGEARPKWTGSLSGAVSSTHGNTTAESVSASVSAARRTEKDRTTAEADYGKSAERDPDTGEEETTEDWWRAKAQYDYFFTKKFFGFGNGRYERDDIAQLDRRVVVGGGAGYQWIETEDRFSTGFGLASLYEKFDYPHYDSNSDCPFRPGTTSTKDLGESAIRPRPDLLSEPGPVLRLLSYHHRRASNEPDQEAVCQPQGHLQLRCQPRDRPGQHGRQVPARRRAELLTAENEPRGDVSCAAPTP